MRRGSYNKLDNDGFAPLGTRVSVDDVIIEKTSPIAQNDDAWGSSSQYKWHDHSISLCHSQAGMVDQVSLWLRWAWKGMLTYTQEDMPWTVEVITPDIIINPHTIPSRMTVVQLIECIIGKSVAKMGMEGDDTPFADINVDNISKALHEMGYQKHGYETMYNGHTGRCITDMIFLGPVYYQRLKHMVDDKIQSLEQGPVQVLTRQPTEGQSSDGGPRVGEIERDCIITHGATLLLKERLFDHSDPYRVHVCEQCGLVAIRDVNKLSLYCKRCKNGINIIQASIFFSTFHLGRFNWKV